jgi:hypothetical protein
MLNGIKLWDLPENHVPCQICFNSGASHRGALGGNDPMNCFSRCTPPGCVWEGEGACFFHSYTMNVLDCEHLCVFVYVVNTGDDTR